MPGLSTISGRLALCAVTLVAVLSVAHMGITFYYMSLRLENGARNLPPREIGKLPDALHARPGDDPARIVASLSHPLAILRLQDGPPRDPGDIRLHDREPEIEGALTEIGADVLELRIYRRRAPISGAGPRPMRLGNVDRGPSFRDAVASVDFMPNYLEPVVGPPEDPQAARLTRIYVYAMRVSQLPDGWVNVYAIVPPRPWRTLVPGMQWTLVAMVLGLGLAIWIGSRLTAPLRSLADRAERIGRGDDAQPLPEDGPTDVRSIVSAFNRMSLRIEHARSVQTSLIYSLGHDVKTPVRHALGALRDGDCAAALRHLERTLSTVDAIGTFSESAHVDGPVERVDLASLLEVLVDDFRSAGQSVDLDLRNEPIVTARPGALERIFLNLVDNAIKHGGRARIVLTADAGSAATVTINDDGPGIEDALSARLTRPFVQGNDAGDGASRGLGLAIVTTLVADLGGDLQLANRPEGGLSARVWIPYSSGSGANR